MIRRPTVLILGAGASQPYGFPVGSDLVDRICKDLLDKDSSDAGFRWRLEERFSNRPGSVDAFAQALRNARTYSIDSFLETRSDYRDIGKAAIADVLLRTELPVSLAGASRSVDWYRYLFNVLCHRSVDNFVAQAHLLTVITFNFDRSFERALFSTLRFRFGITDEEARHLALTIEIHHVHGLLGDPDWLRPDSATGNPYGTESLGDAGAFSDAITRAASSIKNVHDNVDQAVVKEVQASLRNADFVYFVGLGFDLRNLERIGMPDMLKPPTVVRGTNFGMTPAECQAAVRLFNKAGRALLLHDMDALTFCRTHAETLFDD